MGEAKRRAEHGPMVSVLIPERGRPEALERCICSLLDTAASDHDIEIIVFIDTDDEAWIDREPLEHSRTRYLRRPRPITLGEKLNELAAEARGAILLFVANDQVMETMHWPDRVRQAMAQLPNGIGVGHLRDETHPHHTSYWALTRAMYEGCGIFAPPWFVYWFVDTWWNEIGELTGLKVEIDAEVISPDGRGRTHALADLEFWTSLFERTRPMRVRDAVQLLAVAYGHEAPQTRAMLSQLGERQRACALRTAHMRSPEFLARWGGNAASPPGPRYAEAREIAETVLAEIDKQTPRRPKIAICVPSGRTWEANTANAVAALTAHASMAGIEIAMINVQTSLITHGRNTTVRIALEENCDALFWIDSDIVVPPDTLLRLMQHDKDVVGCTYNRRTPDPQGKYCTLGRFAGEQPEVMHDGLHEALLLPSGCLLVKARVYKAMPQPWYAETVMWPGADGLERFKQQMRTSWWQVPSEAVLNSLDSTAFAEWIRVNYCLGEHGEPVDMFSEDLYFCRQARRAGFQIWCDVGLTHKVVHLGTLQVTTLKPPEAVVPMAAE